MCIRVKLKCCNGDLCSFISPPQIHPYRVCVNCAVFNINICCFIAVRNNSKPINVNSQAVHRVYVFRTVEYVVSRHPHNVILFIGPTSVRHLFERRAPTSVKLTLCCLNTGTQLLFRWPLPVWITLVITPFPLWWTFTKLTQYNNSNRSAKRWKLCDKTWNCKLSNPTIAGCGS